MLDPVSRRHNRQNLVLANDALRDYAPFPFFGTLLGLTREGDVLKRDDDIDLYIEMRHRTAVIERMSRAGFDCGADNPANATPFFLQGKRLVGNILTYVDIYFYENRESDPWIVDRWNFGGTPHKDETHLHIRKDLVFPLVEKTFFDKPLFMPNRPRKCCAFLYGDQWSRKLSKAAGQYTVAVHEHQPVVVRRDEFAFALLQGKRAIEADVETNLRPRIDALAGERDGLAAHRDHIGAERDALRGERDALRAEVDRLAAECAEARALRDEAVVRATQSAAEAAQGSGETGELLATLAALSGDRDALRSECDRLAAGLAEADARRDEAAARADLAEGENAKIMARAGELEAALAGIAAERDASSARADRLAADGADSEARLGAALARAEGTEGEIAKAGVREGELRSALAAIAGERDAARERADRLTADLDGVTRQKRDALAAAEALAEEASAEKDHAIGRLHAEIVAQQEAEAKRRASRRTWLGRPAAPSRTPAELLADLGFDGAAYCEAYPDVRASGIDPAEHYVLCGRAEGRRPRFRSPGG